MNTPVYPDASIMGLKMTWANLKMKIFSTRRQALVGEFQNAEAILDDSGLCYERMLEK